MTANLWKVTVADAPDTIGEIELALGEMALAITLRPLDNGQHLLELIFGEPPVPELLADFADVEIKCTPLEPRDWLAAGAHGKQPAPAGGFTLQRDSAYLRSGRRLSLDSVHAFGDGHHATTRGCLAALAYLHKHGVSPRWVGDIGCGTGVLGIAAAKLWPKATVRATDIDLTAIIETGGAIVANGVQPQVKPRQAKGFDSHRGHYDLLLMNILAQPLALLAAQAVVRTRPGGYLVLSGLLTEQRGLVMGAYRPQRLALVTQSRQDGWMTLILRKRPAI